jgi:hypothetical protein
MIKKSSVLILFLGCSGAMLSQTQIESSPIFYENGYVGIGTTEPFSKFHVYSNNNKIDWNSTISNNYHTNSSFPGVGLKLRLGDASEAKKWAGICALSTNIWENDVALTFYTSKANNPTEKVRVTANGNLGIGTDQVPTKLYVSDPHEGMVWNTTLSNEYHTEKGNQGVGLKFKLGHTSEAKKWAGICALSTNAWENDVALTFYTSKANNPTEKVRVTANGYVGIGTTTPKAKLDVAGTIRATEIKVEAQTADFVFEDNYPLRTLDEVEAFIKENGHLPDFCSAEEMKSSGVNLAEMNKLLLQKIEELTLYAIERDKEVREIKEDRTRETKTREELEAEIKRQKAEMKMQKTDLEAMKNELSEIKALLLNR